MEPARIGGTALKNGLVLQSDRYWAAAVRDPDGTTRLASGRRPRLDGLGARNVPLIRGLTRFGESLLTLAQVSSKLGSGVLPIEGTRVAAALTGSLVATSLVRAVAPRSALVQEAGMALAAFVPAILALKDSWIAGYHGAEHKLIGGREANPQVLSKERHPRSMVAAVRTSWGPTLWRRFSPVGRCAGSRWTALRWVPRSRGWLASAAP